MVVALQRELEEFIERLVSSGQFRTRDAAIAEAVLRMKEREEKVAWLRKELQEGLDELDRGEGVPWDVEEMKARFLKKHSSAKD